MKKCIRRTLEDKDLIQEIIKTLEDASEEVDMENPDNPNKLRKIKIPVLQVLEKIEFCLEEYDTLQQMEANRLPRVKDFLKKAYHQVCALSKLIYSGDEEVLDIVFKQKEFFGTGILIDGNEPLPRDEIEVRIAEIKRYFGSKLLNLDPYSYLRLNSDMNGEKFPLKKDIRLLENRIRKTSTLARDYILIPELVEIFCDILCSPLNSDDTIKYDFNFEMLDHLGLFIEAVLKAYGIDAPNRRISKRIIGERGQGRLTLILKEILKTGNKRCRQKFYDAVGRLPKKEVITIDCPEHGGILQICLNYKNNSCNESN